MDILGNSFSLYTDIVVKQCIKVPFGKICSIWVCAKWVPKLWMLSEKSKNFWWKKKATQIRASKIRATKISSNHRELHGAIFSPAEPCPDQLPRGCHTFCSAALRCSSRWSGWGTGSSGHAGMTARCQCHVTHLLNGVHWPQTASIERLEHQLHRVVRVWFCWKTQVLIHVMCLLPWKHVRVSRRNQ